MRFKRMFIIDRCWMLDASDWTMRTISIVLRYDVKYCSGEKASNVHPNPNVLQQQDWKNNRKTGKIPARPETKG